MLLGRSLLVGLRESRVLRRRRLIPESCQPGRTRSVLLGNGARTVLCLVMLWALGTTPSYAGGFITAPTYVVGNSPQSMAVADLNADGIPDLAVANDYAETVSILLGNGDGTFQTAQSYAVGARPVAVTVGDFNRDGALDLALTSFWSGTVSILPGNGDGSFRTPQGYAVGWFPRSVGVGDFNGDGFLDIAVVNENWNTATILINSTIWPP